MDRKHFIKYHSHQRIELYNKDEIVYLTKCPICLKKTLTIRLLKKHILMLNKGKVDCSNTECLVKDKTVLKVSLNGTHTSYRYGTLLLPKLTPYKKRKKKKRLLRPRIKIYQRGHLEINTPEYKRVLIKKIPKERFRSLTDEQILFAVNMKGSMTARELAVKFGVTLSVIYNTWYRASHPKEYRENLDRKNLKNFNNKWGIKE